MTKTAQNQLALLAAAAVALTLFMIFPASRGWITTHCAAIANYTNDALLAPVLGQLGSWFTGAWGWIAGLLS